MRAVRVSRLQLPGQFRRDQLTSRSLWWDPAPDGRRYAAETDRGGGRRRAEVGRAAVRILLWEEA